MSLCYHMATVAAVTRNTFPATLFPLKFWSTSASADYTYLMKTGLCSNFVLQCGCSKPWFLAKQSLASYTSTWLSKGWVKRNCSWLVLLSCFWLDEVSGLLSLIFTFGAYIDQLMRSNALLIILHLKDFGVGWGWGAGEWSEFEVKLVCEDLRAAMIYAWVCNTYRSRPHVLCFKFTSMWMLCRFTKS
ncbi:uncharacterized protein LOC110911554 isoform X1 [Helianthus annuus]|nr:uncharacterized protein LOC110911554 isoform X1 [Helianthus annuus]XP_035840462.1 uncharacterized protein LOC110911554 isoform X1 [Helianthus annuus]